MLVLKLKKENLMLEQEPQEIGKCFAAMNAWEEAGNLNAKKNKTKQKPVSTSITLFCYCLVWDSTDSSPPGSSAHGVHGIS